MWLVYGAWYDGILRSDILWKKRGMGDMEDVGGMVNGENTVCGMVFVDGMIREKHSIWYGTFAVWYHGTVSWMYYKAKPAWWCGMFQYVRSVRVKYAVRVSSVTTLYIDHCRVFENISLADRQTDRQTNIHPSSNLPKQRLSSTN